MGSDLPLKESKMKVSTTKQEGAEQSVTRWNKNIPFPKDCYQARCIEEEFKRSSNNNPMVVHTYEIISDKPRHSGDKLVDVDQLKVMKWFVLEISDENGEVDKEKTAKAVEAYGEVLRHAGYEGEDWDTTQPPLVSKGKIFDMIIESKADKMYKDPTPEERAAGKKTGAPIKTPDGKDVIIYNLNINTIYGISTVENNKPY